jgi:DNA-binding NtrC family response regulator
MSEEVLVVDDEPQMLIAIHETLRRSGYAVTTAGSAMEALCRLREKYFNLVITDYRMPEVTGIDLLKKLKNLAPQTPVVMLTAYGTIQNAVDAMRLGAFDYLLKPFSSESLEGVVRRALVAARSAEKPASHEIVTQDRMLGLTLERACQVAPSTATVLIEAESGTGKELLARLIHSNSPRKQGPFVAVNCAALPESLLESELFGFEKGAFTGANSAKPGKFELAHKGTLLLDEIGEMAPILQAKLLRVLQEKEVDRVGGTDPVKIDVRVIATTNRNLRELVQHGSFREDLFYRLNVVSLSIPPLRDRRDDIPLLADFFCKRYAVEFGRVAVTCSEATIVRLKACEWPGNVRELENAIQRAVALCPGSVIEDLDGVPPPRMPIAAQLPAKPAAAVAAGTSMRDMEKELIRRTLDETGGNRTHAARLLGISIRTLRNKLNEFGLQDRPANFAQARAQI